MIEWAAGSGQGIYLSTAAGHVTCACPLQCDAATRRVQATPCDCSVPLQNPLQNCCGWSRLTTSLTPRCPLRYITTVRGTSRRLAFHQFITALCKGRANEELRKSCLLGQQRRKRQPKRRGAEAAGR